MRYGLRLLKNRPKVIIEDEFDSNDEDMVNARFQGNQFADTQELKPNDWSNFEDVSLAVEQQLCYWAEDYSPQSRFAVTLETTRTGRLCEVLTLLMGEPQTKKHIFG